MNKVSMKLIRKCIYVWAMAFVLLIWHGCEKVILSGEGELLTIFEKYDEFEGITFYDIFHVRLVSDSVFSVSLMVHEKYRDDVSFVLDCGVISPWWRSGSHGWTVSCYWSLPYGLLPQIHCAFPG